jgi:hypothetical protein
VHFSKVLRGSREFHLVANPRASRRLRLEGDQHLVWAFDFVLGLQELFTPWLAGALGTLVNRVADRETVVAGTLGAGARKLLACLAGLEELAFECSVLAPKFALTDDANIYCLRGSPST